MKHIFTSVRHPVKRQSADDYLLITLLSFAASVGGTRLFLEITGYPQIGGEDCTSLMFFGVDSFYLLPV